MKGIRKAAHVLLLSALSCMMLAMLAFAAGDESVWFTKTEASDGKGAVISIVTDAAVTDGVATLKYDSNLLTYAGVETEDAYVAMYSVNAEEAGVVRISWVAPSEPETDGSGSALIKVNFTGDASAVSQDSIALSGTAYDANGAEIPVGTLDTTELEKAVALAESLDAGKYTEESYAAVEKALAGAKAVLADPAASQGEVDAAAKALLDAIDALELKVPASGKVDTTELEKAIALAEGLDASKYTKESYDELEKALTAAKAVLANADATQDEVNAAAKALLDAVNALKLAGSTSGVKTGDTAMVAVAAGLAVAAAAGFAVCAVNKRRGAK